MLCTPDAEAAAKEAGANYVGLDEYIDKIKGRWTDIDVIITIPSIIGKIGALGRVLGPRGLMPNPKSGTVTMDVAKAVKEVKQGKIDFKVDKSGICLLYTSWPRTFFRLFLRCLPLAGVSSRMSEYLAFQATSLCIM